MTIHFQSVQSLELCTTTTIDLDTINADTDNSHNSAILKESFGKKKTDTKQRRKALNKVHGQVKNVNYSNTVHVYFFCPCPCYSLFCIGHFLLYI